MNEKNGILGEMLKKAREDTDFSFEIALPWAISAKNTGGARGVMVIVAGIDTATRVQILDWLHFT